MESAASSAVIARRHLKRDPKLRRKSVPVEEAVRRPDDKGAEAQRAHEKEKGCPSPGLPSRVEAQQNNRSGGVFRAHAQSAANGSPVQPGNSVRPDRLE